MKIQLLIFTLLLLIGCSPTYKIAENEYLLERNVIVDKHSGIEKSEIEKFIRQKPNRKILKIIPFHTWLYSTINKEKLNRQKEKRNLRYDKVNQRKIQKTDQKNTKIERKNQKIQLVNSNRAQKGLKPKQLKPFKLPKLKDKQKLTWRENILEAGEKPVILDSFQTKITREQLQKFLFTKGFFYAQVKDSTVKTHKTKFKRSVNKAAVYYQIKKCDRYRINQIQYKIEDEQLGYYLFQDTVKSLIVRGAFYDVDLLQLERDRITKSLKNNGYFEFAQEYVHYDIDTNLSGNKVNITLIVNSFTYKTEKRDSVLKKPHTRFFINTIQVISDFNSNNKTGYTDTLHYNDVAFLSNGKLNFKMKDIVSKIMIHPGEVFNLDLAEETYSKLSDLRVFKSVNLIFNISKNAQDRLDCIIQLAPVLKQNFTIESEVTNTSNNLGISGSFVYQNKNLFMGAELLEIKLRGGLTAQQNLVKDTVATNPESFLNSFNTIQFGPELNLYIPKQLFPFTVFHFQKNASPKTIFNSSFNFQKRPEFSRTLTNLSYGFQFKNGNFVKQIITPFEFSIIKATLSSSFRDNLLNSKDNFLINSFTDHITTVSRFSYVFNNQTSKTNNTLSLFQYAKFDFESGGNVLRGIFNLSNQHKNASGSYQLLNIPFAQFVRFFYDYRLYKNIRKLSKFVFRATGGLGKPLQNLNVLPYEKSFFSGGPNSIRAWRARTIGPGSYNQINDANFDKIGDIQMEFNIEYRFNIYKFLNGAWFFDAGNIWLLNFDFEKIGAEFKLSRFYKEFAAGSGFGLRADFSFFILRLDLAFKLYNPALPEGNRWTFNQKPLKSTVVNFGIGYPF